MDSDGDGNTNGEELGDPDCVSTEGAVPQILDNICHPGKEDLKFEFFVLNFILSDLTILC